MTRFQFGTDATAHSRLTVQANQLRPGDVFAYTRARVIEPGVMPDPDNRPGLVRVPIVTNTGICRTLRPCAETQYIVERPNLTIPGLGEARPDAEEGTVIFREQASRVYHPTERDRAEAYAALLDRTSRVDWSYYVYTNDDGTMVVMREVMA